MLLSAALIVRDEQKHLPDCLRSIQPLVDEIVVVDTGSRDRSVAIARRFGARVERIKWRGSFSAARNRALELADGEWILYIDADERARPCSRARLRRELADTRSVAWEVLLYPRAGFTPHRVVRLFRNHPSIRFEGIVHENILPGLNRYRARHGGRIGVSSLSLDHEGYSDGALAGKHERYLPLLRKAVRAEPTRVYYWCHLASIYHGLGRVRLAEDAWQRARAVVQRKRWFQPEDVLPYVALGELQLNEGKDAREVIAEGLARFPKNAHLRWLHARALMTKERYEEAIATLESLVAYKSPDTFDQTTSYDRRLFGSLSFYQLASCYFSLRDYRRSQDYFARAARAEPDNLELRVKLALARRLARTAV